MRKINKLAKTIRKNTRITLLERLNNIGKNVVENPLQVILPTLTALAISGSVRTGINAYETAKINKGYTQAHSQVQHIKEVLNSDPDYWECLPFNTNVFEPVGRSVDLSLSKKDSKGGREIRDLADRVQGAVYSPYLNDYAKKTAMKNLEDTLKSASETSGGYLAGSLALGLLSVIGIAISLGLMEDSFFKNYNRDKKILRKQGSIFLEEVRELVKQGALDDESVGYLGRFFEGMKIERDSHNSYNLFTVLKNNLNVKKENKPVLRALAEGPRYNSVDVEGLFLYYSKLDKGEVGSSSDGNEVKRDSDLLLDLWIRERDKHPADFYETITAARSIEKSFPEMIAALTSGSAKVSEIKRANAFLSKSLFPKKITEDFVRAYLANPSNQKLPKGNIGVFEHYAKRKLEKHTPEAGLRLVSDLEGLRSLIEDHKDQRTLNHGYGFWSNEETDIVVDIALEASRKNPELGRNVLRDARLIVGQDPAVINTRRMIYSRGFIPTAYLVKRLVDSPDKEGELNSWEKTRDDISSGGFDTSDPLKLNLEYTRYYLEADKARKSNSFGSYMLVVTGGGKWTNLKRR